MHYDIYTILEKYETDINVLAIRPNNVVSDWSCVLKTRLDGFSSNNTCLHNW